MRWRYPLVEIGDLVISVKKWNPCQSKVNELINYIDISSVNRETKEVEDVIKVFTHEAPSRARQLVMKGDVLVSTVRPNLNAVAHLETELDRATASTGFTVLRPDSKKICDRYLYYWVRSPYFVQDMVRRSTGASYPVVTDSIIKSYNIPLPPLEEQKRIAAILDKADAIRRSRKKAIRLTEELLRSTFLDMFGDPVTNPKGWNISNLSNVCRKITDGTHHSPPIVEEGIPYITAKHLKKSGLEFYLNPWFVDEKEHKKIYSRCNPQKGDVLYIKDGATTGIAAINNYDFEFSMLSSLALLKVGDNLTSEYLCDWLNSENVKRKHLASLAGAAITRLTLKKIKDFHIPVPPLDVQYEYKKIRQNIARLESNICNDLNTSENFFNSLLQKAFRGEL
jgi:type I restriction enzyme S subunit